MVGTTRNGLFAREKKKKTGWEVKLIKKCEYGNW